MLLLLTVDRRQAARVLGDRLLPACVVSETDAPATSCFSQEKHRFRQAWFQKPTTRVTRPFQKVPSTFSGGPDHGRPGRGAGRSMAGAAVPASAQVPPAPGPAVHNRFMRDDDDTWKWHAPDVLYRAEDSPAYVMCARSC